MRRWSVGASAVAATVLLAACQGSPQLSSPKTDLARFDRCDGLRDDATVAGALNISLDRLIALRKARALSNDDLCVIPERQLSRAQRRVDVPKPDRPGEWARQRGQELADDTGTVPAGGLLRALDQRQQHIQAAAARYAGLTRPSIAGLDSTRWTSVGPSNIPGRTRAITIHPSDGNRIWVGTVSGGIWYTTDGGSNWRALNDFMANLAVTSIVIDPTNSSLMYAATGEGFFNADAIPGGGVFKSTDGGATWIRLSATDPGSDSNWRYVNRLAAHPSTTGILLAANRSAGVYRSTDGGTTWSRVLSTSGSNPYAYFVAFDPNNGSNAIAGLGDGKVAYSTDAGANWSTTTIASTGGSFSGRVELAYAKATSGTVYASVQDSSSGSIYRSTNGGASWSLRSSPGHLGSQGWYDNTIWVDPADSNNVVTGGIDLYRSTDAGANFTKISTWFLWPSSPHADQHTVVHHPSYDGSSNRIVFVGNDGGVWKSTDILSATSSASSNTWSSVSTGIRSTQFYGGASSADGTKIIGGTQDNGSLVTNNSSATWSTTFGGDGGFAAIDQTDSNYVYGEYVYASIHRSTDGGASANFACTGIDDNADYCSGSTTAANFISPFILDPNSQSRMLVGANRLWVSDNVKASTPSWTSKKAAISSSNYISAIAVATGNSDRIWVGHNGGQVYYTTNGTATSPTWTAVSIGPARKVLRIYIDPSDSNIVYVGFAGLTSSNLWKTTNGGTSWTDISSGLPQAPVRGIVRHPSNASWLYVGTEVGIYTSETGGSSWATSNDGPATVSIDELFFAGTTTTLVAVTHGRGIWTASVSTSNTGTTSPQSGWWWNSSESGRGFSLETSGNNIFFAGYMYSPDGKPVWYISSGARQSNSVYQGTMLQYSGGQTLSGAYQAPTSLGSVGNVTLSFDSTTAGRLAFAGGTISIARYEFSTGGVAAGPASGMPQTGWWWSSSESGRGYFIEVQNSTMFFAAYMYDSTGQAAWYISTGSMTSTSLYQGSLLEYRNGQVLGGAYQAASLHANQGTITIQFSSQTAGTLTLPNGSQVAITRFTF
jgi:photosystem II stability/assembly factor-like uncharacterized protein